MGFNHLQKFAMKPFKGVTQTNTALIIVDVINSCAHEDFEIPQWNIHFTKIRKMIPKLNGFIEKFRSHYTGPVIFGKTVPWRKEFLASNVNELYEQEKYSYYSKDTSGRSEEFYGIKPQEGDLIFDKKTNDVLTKNNLVTELEQRKIKYLVVTGVFSDGCVLATVLGGFAKGFNIIVPRDLCETTDSPTRQLIQQKTV